MRLGSRPVILVETEVVVFEAHQQIFIIIHYDTERGNKVVNLQNWQVKYKRTLHKFQCGNAIVWIGR